MLKALFEFVLSLTIPRLLALDRQGRGYRTGRAVRRVGVSAHPLIEGSKLGQNAPVALGVSSFLICSFARKPINCGVYQVAKLVSMHGSSVENGTVNCSNVHASSYFVPKNPQLVWAKTSVRHVY